MPVRDRAGPVAAAVTISAQISCFSATGREAEILPPLREAASRIEDYFGLECGLPDPLPMLPGLNSTGALAPSSSRRRPGGMPARLEKNRLK